MSSLLRFRGVLAPLALIAASGCGMTMMTAQGAPVPVLIGPVSCIGCAPGAPPGPLLAPINDHSGARLMAAGGSNVTTSVSERGFSSLGRKVAAVVRDPCRIDVHVSKLTSSAIGVFALFFAMTSVDIDVEAAATLVPGGTCAANP